MSIPNSDFHHRLLWRATTGEYYLSMLAEFFFVDRSSHGLLRGQRVRRRWRQAAVAVFLGLVSIGPIVAIVLDLFDRLTPTLAIALLGAYGALAVMAYSAWLLILPLLLLRGLLAMPFGAGFMPPAFFLDISAEPSPPGQHTIIQLSEPTRPEGMTSHESTHDGHAGLSAVVDWLDVQLRVPAA